jgi:hypothetical protein
MYVVPKREIFDRIHVMNIIIGEEILCGGDLIRGFKIENSCPIGFIFNQTLARSLSHWALFIIYSHLSLSLSCANAAESPIVVHITHIRRELVASKAAFRD